MFSRRMELHHLQTIEITALLDLQDVLDQGKAALVPVGERAPEGVACRVELHRLLEDRVREDKPGGTVCGEGANLKGLVFGCIETKFCK